MGEREAPLDPERFFETHFTKVSEQTKLQIADYVNFGLIRKKPMTHLQGLIQAAYGT